MKKCQKCGAVQSDDRSTCIDCGTLLGHSLTEEESALADAELHDRLTGMAERAEDFYVPLRDRIMGILCIAGIIAAVVLLIFCGMDHNEILGDIPDGVTVTRGDGAYISISGDAVTEYHFPSAKLRTLEMAQGMALLGLVLLLVAGVMLLFPKLMWQLGTLRYRLFHGWDTTPSDFALICRKVVTYILFAFGMVCIAYALWLYLPTVF